MKIFIRIAKQGKRQISRSVTLSKSKNRRTVQNAAAINPNWEKLSPWTRIGFVCLLAVANKKGVVWNRLDNKDPENIAVLDELEQAGFIVRHRSGCSYFSIVDIEKYQRPAGETKIVKNIPPKIGSRHNQCDSISVHKMMKRLEDADILQQARFRNIRTNKADVFLVDDDEDDKERVDVQSLLGMQLV